MRILIVSQYFWPENFRINDLAAELMARGHRVTVLTGLPNYPDGTVFPDYRRDPPAFARFGDAEVVRVPVLPRGNGSLRLVLNYLSFALSGTLLGPWKLRRRRFDAIFAFQTSPVTQVIPALVLRRIKRAPVLTWVLDCWPETLAAVGVVNSRWGLRAVGRLVRAIYRRCDLILVQSRAFAKNVREHAGGLERMRYLPNWPEPIFEHGAAHPVPAKELAPYADDFKLLFAGNIGTAQDFPAVLEAAEALRHEPRLRWIIVGDGRAAPMLRREVERRGLMGEIVLLGRHPLERMPSFFAGADALLVSLCDEPIYAMTIPGKVQSYLAAGRPVLAMLNGEGARVINESGAGFAAPAGDGTALAERVRAMMALSVEERDAMGRAGAAYCEREFGRDRIMDLVETWLEEVRARPLRVCH